MESTMKYEIVTPAKGHDEARGYQNGKWESDSIGENAPRTYAECEADIEALRDGRCGPEFTTIDYAIRDTTSGMIIPASWPPQERV